MTRILPATCRTPGRRRIDRLRARRHGRRSTARERRAQNRRWHQRRARGQVKPAPPVVYTDEDLRLLDEWVADGCRP